MSLFLKIVNGLATQSAVSGTDIASGSVTAGQVLAASGSGTSAFASLTVGTFDSAGSPSANGLVFNGLSLLAQSATPSNPGMVNTGLQTFAGNKNFNHISKSFSATATAAGTTTLSVTSSQIQQFTGTTTQNITLPDCTTLTVGFAFSILNRSTGSITVKNNAGTTLQVQTSNTQALYVCSNIASAAGVWDVTYTGAQGATASTKQVFLSGSGTYTTPAGVVYIEVEMIGGGGGGGGSGIGGGLGGTGGNGGATTFGTSLLISAGGGGGANVSVGSPGGGGAASLGVGPVGIALTGANGNAGGATISNATAIQSGAGGSSPFGGEGGALCAGPAANSAQSNTGSGGGGAAMAQLSTQNTGHGGGAGGYIKAIINSPLSTYAYVIGAGGIAGTTGTSGGAGGVGGSGLIVVTEYYASGAISTATNVTGIVAVANGGTGQTSIQAAKTAFNIAPTFQTFLSTPTTTGRVFTTSSCNATKGATYTNNGQTFTVQSTVAGFTLLPVSGTGTPLASGTLTKATGTGDATITFSTSVVSGTYTPTSANVLYIEVEMVGGGGGGGGSGTAGQGASPTAGTFSIFFNPSITNGLGLTFGGNQAASNIVGGSGAGAANAAGIPLVTVVGGGAGSGGTQLSSFALPGGIGGGSALGGAGVASVSGNPGGPGAANTGGGGGGAGLGGGAAGTIGGGGGASSYIKFTINAVLATSFPIVIGVGGIAGTAGTGGQPAGAGGSGFMLIKEYYQ